MQLRVWKKDAEHPPFEVLEMIRTHAQASVSRFARLIGLSRRTYCYRLARRRRGYRDKGPWPAPVLDRIEPEVAKLAEQYPASGHRKARR